MKVQKRLAAIGTFLLFAIGAGAPAPAAAGNAVGPGCDPSRPAVAYRAGLGAVTSHQGNRPIPCAVVTGSTMETAPVGVSQDGTLVYAPQSTGAAAAPAIFTSKDDGATWQVQTPTLQPHTGSAIPWMHLDPQTNRIWFAMIGPAGSCPPGTYAQVSWSDDEGHSWQTPPGDPASCRQLQGGMSIVEGPAPKGQPQPVGYPHVVYHCGNISDGAVPLSVHCWKSLDGGQTWSFVQGPNNPPSDCVGKFGGRGRAIGPDGTLYMSMQCQPTAAGVAIAGPGALYLASSRDEGNTWNYQLVVNTSYELTQALGVSSLAADQAGNLYIVWVDENNSANLIVGKGGRWGSPMNIAEPGVTFVTRVAVTVNNPGNIAMAYVGSEGPVRASGVLDPSSTFNGYITESNNAIGSDPTFLGAPVNDPASPLMSSAYAEAITATRGRLWLLSVAFGRDGTPYAGFHCGNMTLGSTTGMDASITCPNGEAPPPAPLALGVVGSLVSHNGSQNAQNGN
jgi:hypothetical protein